MTRFVHDLNTAYTVFGSGLTGQVSDTLDRIGGSRPFLVMTSSQRGRAMQVRDELGARIVGEFGDVVMHTPVAVTENVLEIAAAAGADSVIAIGGGSAIGLSKALALRTGWPQLVMPTTYAGSEVTPVLGQTENGVKTTVRDARILPRAVLYDVDATLCLPVATSVTSGFNAIAHAVEGLYAANATPLTDAIAERAIAVMVGALPAIARDPGDRAAREQALEAAWLCGLTLAATNMGLHHKLCHTLGGALDLPHAETHTLILPHTLAYNAPGIPKAVAAISRALDHDAPWTALFKLAESLGARMALSDFGVTDGDIPRLVQQATATPYPNPVPVEAGPVQRLLSTALMGAAPVVQHALKEAH